VLAAGVLAAASIVSGSAQRSPDGTAEVSGTVISTATPSAPLARVLVTMSGDSLKPSRTIVTDELGRFAFSNLPSGTFTIVAARPPYVTTAFGAKRPGRPGTPIGLAAGQRMTGITIPLARGAAITGMIRTTSGEAAPGVGVEVVRLDTQTTQSGAPVVTDDRGVYRVFGLPPGRYLVKAGASEVASSVITQLSDSEMDEILATLQRRPPGVAAARNPVGAPGALGAPASQSESNRRPATYGYAPVYYPGTPDPEQAVALALAEEEEHAGIDIDLQFVRTAAIEGRVTSASGDLPSGTQITLTRLGPRAGAANTLITPATSRAPDSAGAFRFTGVLPGRYRVVARAIGMAPVSAAAPQAGAGAPNAPAAYTVTGVSWALADVTVGDDDVSGIALALQPGLRLSGRIALDTRAQTQPPDLAMIRLRLVDVTGATFTPVGSVRADGTFEIDGILPGIYGMTPVSAPAGWSLRSVTIEGRDILDFPLEIGATGDVGGAVVTLTDRQTELAGTLQSAANVPAPDYFVVVFSPDRAYWRPASRRVRFTRPGTDGRYTLAALPAGDYLVAALTDLEPADLLDESFIERLISSALPVRLGEGEKKTLDLRLVK